MSFDEQPYDKDDHDLHDAHEEIESLHAQLTAATAEYGALTNALNVQGLPIYPIEAISFLKSLWKDAFLDGMNIHAWKQKCDTLRAEMKNAREAIIEVMSDLEGGFVRCQRCGGQEDTATLDCVRILKAVLAPRAENPAGEGE